MQMRLAKRIHEAFETAGFGVQGDLIIGRTEDNHACIKIKTGCLNLLLCAMASLDNVNLEDLTQIAGLTIDTMVIDGYMKVS